MVNEVRVLSEEEGRLLLNALEGRDRIVVMSLYAGLRTSEVFGLRWENVDFERGLISVYSRSRMRTVCVSLPAAIVAELKDYKANSTGDGLFRDQSQGGYTRYFRRPRGVLKRLLSDNVTFATLRHSFAAQLIK